MKRYHAGSIAGLAGGAVLALTSLARPSAAAAEELYIVAMTEEAGILLYTESVSPLPAGTKRAWFLMMNKEPLRLEGEPPAQVLRILNEVDCTRERMRTLSMSVLTKEMQVVFSDDEPTTWTYAAPDTRGKDMVDSVCNASARTPEQSIDGSTSQAVDTYFRLMEEGKLK